MLKSNYSLIAPVILFTAAVACAVGLEPTRKTWIALAALTLPALISIFLSYVRHSKRKSLSCLLYGAGLLMFLVFILLVVRNSTDVLDFMSRKAIELMVLIPWSATTILIVIAGIPLALRSPSESEWTAGDQGADQGVDLAGIDSQKPDKVTESFHRLKNAIRRGTSEIDDASENFRALLTSQEETLKELRNASETAKRQVQIYESIINLPKGQLKDLVDYLSGRKRHEYLAGFLIGLLSSGLVQVLAAVVPKLIE